MNQALSSTRQSDAAPPEQAEDASGQDVSSAGTPNDTGDALRRRAIDAEEHVRDVLRLRTALAVGALIWPLWLVVDWLVVSHLQTGSLWHFAVLRAVALVPCCITLARLYRKPMPSRAMTRVLEQTAFVWVAVVMTLIGFLFGGISSVYGIGVVLVMLCRGVTIADPFRRGIWTVGLTALAFPVTVVAGALVSDTLAAELTDPKQLTGFAVNLGFIATAYVLLVAQGHLVWAVRRQLFERRNLGRYQLKRRVGAGGMGEVWVARHAVLKRDVALKILRPDIAFDAGARARFEREVRALSELRHPNTVRIMDYGITDDGLSFFAMELLDGENLGELVARVGPLPAARVIHLASQACRALAEAHRLQIVHRDIKPENLFVASLGGEHDVLKVLDYGIAKVSFGDVNVPNLTQSGWVGGTPLYMSPEVTALKPADSRADVYGLGAVLYFALSGRAPFDGTVTSVLVAHRAETPEPPSKWLGRPLPADLEEVVLRCLEKDPDRRYPDASALGLALGACAGAGKWTPNPPEPAAAGLEHWLDEKAWADVPSATTVHVQGG